MPEKLDKEEEREKENDSDTIDLKTLLELAPGLPHSSSLTPSVRQGGVFWRMTPVG
jgi:hypothetical protein